MSAVIRSLDASRGRRALRHFKPPPRSQCCKWLLPIQLCWLRRGAIDALKSYVPFGYRATRRFGLGVPRLRVAYHTSVPQRVKQGCRVTVMGVHVCGVRCSCSARVVGGRGKGFGAAGRGTNDSGRASRVRADEDDLRPRTPSGTDLGTVSLAGLLAATIAALAA